MDFIHFYEFDVVVFVFDFDLSANQVYNKNSYIEVDIVGRTTTFTTNEGQNEDKNGNEKILTQKIILFWLLCFFFFFFYTFSFLSYNFTWT